MSNQSGSNPQDMKKRHFIEWFVVLVVIQLVILVFFSVFLKPKMNHLVWDYELLKIFNEWFKVFPWWTFFVVASVYWLKDPLRKIIDQLPYTEFFQFGNFQWNRTKERIAEKFADSQNTPQAWMLEPEYTDLEKSQFSQEEYCQVLYTYIDALAQKVIDQYSAIASGKNKEPIWLSVAEKSEAEFIKWYHKIKYSKNEYFKVHTLEHQAKLVNLFKYFSQGMEVEKAFEKAGVSLNNEEE